MTTLYTIRSRLIDRIMVTENDQLLSVIDSIFNSAKTDERLSLNSHQLEMLMMSENDIDLGNLISESDLEKEDSEWMG